ncbi:DegT/DnrJ/EryC1/StrS family aminotransferase [Winogradskyella costae]|uniref:DegT/DnrJ/EryC1/StrS family aminotransferase n=1 Tax=Winogradskyella costae TaxID=2697008 RepID=UPI0015C9984C|nr:DegT/DnrJ/EryC1/StrS family aminotransferase [Winogradskyella costae]
MIKFLDLYKINNRFRDVLQESFARSLDDAHFILGNNVTTFENEFANYCGTKFCIGTGNGLDALTLILKGYVELGKLKKGDRVIVPANTFIATILSVIHADLVPILVEPDPYTYTISVDTDKAVFVDAKAIIMVHLYGQLAKVEELQKLAKDFNLLLFEDAAQAHGAISDLNERKAGNLSDAAAFSFYPTKNLGALGDGGAVTTDNSELANIIKLLRNYGSEKKYTNNIIGFNSRLDDMQAAFLSLKLKCLDGDNERRREIAKAYLKGIKNPKLKLPHYDGSMNHVFYAFVIEVDDRADFIKFLDANSIEWLIHYPVPPHQQEALRCFSYVNLPLTEKIHQRIISLPMSPVMIDKDIQSVISTLNTY